MTVNTALATADATLTAISLVAMTLAYRAIRARPRRIWAHRNLMLVAASASAAFLILFVIRFVRVGFGKFHGAGVAKVLYLIVFFSHEPLAVVNVPLVIAALALGLLRNYPAHREVAPFAFWIWIYVALTGLAIYGALYVF